MIQGITVLGQLPAHHYFSLRDTRCTGILKPIEPEKSMLQYFSLCGAHLRTPPESPLGRVVKRLIYQSKQSNTAFKDSIKALNTAL